MKNSSSHNPTIGLIYFSPTGATKRICEEIAATVSSASPVHINLTKPSSPLEKRLDKADLWIIGAPVHESRLSRLARERLKVALNDPSKAKTPAVAVIVCGNMNVGIALKQLSESLTSTSNLNESAENQSTFSKLNVYRISASKVILVGGEEAELFKTAGVFKELGSLLRGFYGAIFFRYESFLFKFIQILVDKPEVYVGTIN
jgi:hypothetical protein